MSKVRSIILLLRPVTLVPAFTAGIIGYYSLANTIDINAMITGLILALLQAGGQVLNQITDIEIDKINKPFRPLVKGLVSIRDAIILAISLYVISLIISMISTNISFIMISLIIAFFSIFYNLKPIRAKRHYLISYPWLSISRGFLPWILISCIANNLGRAIRLGIITGLWVLSSQCTKDIGDERGDLIFGVKTLPNQYGVRATRIWILGFGVLTVLISQLLGFGIHFMGLLILSILIVLTTNIRLIEGNRLSWLLFYSGIGYIYLASII